jgi:hypothetical protein
MNKAWKKRQGAKIRLAARRAKLVRDALRSSVDVDAVVNDFFAMGFTATTTTEETRAYAKIHIRPNSKEMFDALQTIYVDSYTLGQDIAMSALAKAKINKAPTKAELQRAIGINWDTWKPGNRAAANLIKPPRGLSTLLDRRGVMIQGINKTTLDRIGTILGRALAKGETPESVRDELEDLLDDSERALTIAQTEMSSAVCVASRELYEESGAELVEWLVAAPCDLCQENADASPIGIGDTFPSGDTEPPAHPNCVCDIAPYVVDTRDIGQDALDYILTGE